MCNNYRTFLYRVLGIVILRGGNSCCFASLRALVFQDVHRIVSCIFQGKRKTANAEAVVYGHGSGKIEINGVDYLLYFPVTQDR